MKDDGRFRNAERVWGIRTRLPDISVNTKAQEAPEAPYADTNINNTPTCATSMTTEASRGGRFFPMTGKRALSEADLIRIAADKSKTTAGPMDEV